MAADLVKRALQTVVKSKPLGRQPGFHPTRYQGVYGHILSLGKAVSKTIFGFRPKLSGHGCHAFWWILRIASLRG
jgi:hypothetical protein